MGQLAEYVLEDLRVIDPAAFFGCAAPGIDPWSGPTDRAIAVALAISNDKLAVELVRNHPTQVMSEEQWEVLALLYAGSLRGEGLIRKHGRTRKITPYGRLVQAGTFAALLRNRWIKPTPKGFVLSALAAAYVQGRAQRLQG